MVVQVVRKQSRWELVGGKGKKVERREGKKGRGVGRREGDNYGWSVWPWWWWWDFLVGCGWGGEFGVGGNPSGRQGCRAPMAASDWLAATRWEHRHRPNRTNQVHDKKETDGARNSRRPARAQRKLLKLFRSDRNLTTMWCGLSSCHHCHSEGESRPPHPPASGPRPLTSERRVQIRHTPH